ENIVARVADEIVIAAVADKRIVATGTSSESIVVRVADQRVVEYETGKILYRCQRVGAKSTANGLRPVIVQVYYDAGRCKDVGCRIIALAAVETVVSTSSEKRVVI